MSDLFVYVLVAVWLLGAFARDRGHIRLAQRCNAFAFGGLVVTVALIVVEVAS